MLSKYWIVPTNDDVISGDKITSLEINSFSNDPLYKVINTNDVLVLSTL